MRMWADRIIVPAIFSPLMAIGLWSLRKIERSTKPNSPPPPSSARLTTAAGPRRILKPENSVLTGIESVRFRSVKMQHRDFLSLPMPLFRYRIHPTPTNCKECVAGRPTAASRDPTNRRSAPHQAIISKRGAHHVPGPGKCIERGEVPITGSQRPYAQPNTARNGSQIPAIGLGGLHPYPEEACVGF